MRIHRVNLPLNNNYTHTYPFLSQDSHIHIHVHELHCKYTHSFVFHIGLHGTALVCIFMSLSQVSQLIIIYIVYSIRYNIVSIYNYYAIVMLAMHSV